MVRVGRHGGCWVNGPFREHDYGGFKSAPEYVSSDGDSGMTFANRRSECVSPDACYANFSSTTAVHQAKSSRSIRQMNLETTLR